MKAAYIIIDGKDIPSCESFGSYEKEIRKNKFKNYIQELYNENNDNVDAEKLSEIFFPDRYCDFFLSHSHADEGKAIKLKKLLSARGASVFIDSLTWLSFREMLNGLRSCVRPYCDENRLLELAANAHIMLAVALMRMINRCDYFLFINTPNSMQYQVL